MADHPVKAAIADATSVAKGTLRSYIMARTSLVLSSVAEITSMDVDQAISVIAAGRTYYYDSTDTTTSHDGLNCLVDSTGRRFKLATNGNLSVGVYKVQTKGSNSTPGSPAAGDTHIVGTAPTGSWSTHANTIAVFVGSWVYITPSAGAVAFNVADSRYYSFNGSAWVAGLPSTLAADSIKFSNMLNGVIELIVEGTANDEAGTESNGDAWIVGSAPTGAFAAFSPKSIVIKEDGAWVEYPPSEGWRVDDKSSGNELRFTAASEWTTASSPSKVVRVWNLQGSFTGNGTLQTIVTQSIARSAAGNTLLFIMTLQCDPSGGAQVNTIRLNVDSTTLKTLTIDASTYLHLTYTYTPTDASSHDYKLRTSTDNANPGYYDVVIMELIP